MTSTQRRFCFLQGPHGPFFHELAVALRHLGHGALRISFNQGDAREWAQAGELEPFTGSIEDWKAQAGAWLKRLNVTDLALYGDARAYHRIAIQAAREAGLQLHFFEEGYLRPYWISYERAGVNGESRMMRISLDEMAEELLPDDPSDEIPPARWGELNAHVAHSLRYHIGNHFLNGAYPNFHRHHGRRPIDDWANTAARVAKIPLLKIRRSQRLRALAQDHRAYHLVLLQLAWDASMQRYSRFSTLSEVIETCIKAFAQSAPSDEVLVFKSHPLEDGVENPEKCAFEIAQRVGLPQDRLRFIDGGKLAALIDAAKSVVTVNSTAAQQALWRSKPVKALGQAVFDKPGLASQKALPEFFSSPDAPCPEKYKLYRRFLLATSQIRGGYYTDEGRALALAPTVGAMLRENDPYEAFLRRPPSPSLNPGL